MTNNNQYSLRISIFHERVTPEEATLVGYGAIISYYDLKVPLPKKLSLISDKKRQYQNDNWLVFTPRHKPDENLYKQLIFAIKYEGINLLIFKKLFEKLKINEITELVTLEPLSQYGRRIWFLYEWLMNAQLPIPDLNKGNYIGLLNDKLQYTINGKRSPRQRIINNLPGLPNFCPLVSKTPKLENHIVTTIENHKKQFLNNIHKDVMQRASAFLLLKDSKASFHIEGENPGTNRALRWGRAIGEAGKNELTTEELVRLQHIIIESKRFTKLGFRNEGGFVGEHDRTTGEPIPEHISAKSQDIDQLIYGLLDTYKLLEESDFDPVLTASLIAFGFVFIHPFSDGNGRLHRYLIHHILAKKSQGQKGFVFPVSASILDNLDNYRSVLESYSKPILEFIEWDSTEDHNIEVTNETIDYYRYFDATKQAEFLFDCVLDTLQRIIPQEVRYLNQYDEFKRLIEDRFEMPDKMIATLVRFLEQNNGQLTKRAKSKEFSQLTEIEVEFIEKRFKDIFMEL